MLVFSSLFNVQNGRWHMLHMLWDIILYLSCKLYDIIIVFMQFIFINMQIYTRKSFLSFKESMQNLLLWFHQ